MEEREPAKQKDTRAGEGWSEVPLLSNDDLFALYVVTNTNKTRFQQHFSLPFSCQAEERKKKNCDKNPPLQERFLSGTDLQQYIPRRGSQEPSGCSREMDLVPFLGKAVDAPLQCVLGTEMTTVAVTHRICRSHGVTQHGREQGLNHRQDGGTAGCSPQIFACYLSSSFIFTESLNCLCWKGS